MSMSKLINEDLGVYNNRTSVPSFGALIHWAEHLIYLLDTAKYLPASGHTLLDSSAYLKRLVDDLRTKQEANAPVKSILIRLFLLQDVSDYTFAKIVTLAKNSYYYKEE